jgi:hypothetical protein
LRKVEQAITHEGTSRENLIFESKHFSNTSNFRENGGFDIKQVVDGGWVVSKKSLVV